MIVCMCHAVNERELDRVIAEGADTVEEIGRRTGAGTGCGMCIPELRERLGCDAVDPAGACAGASRCSGGLVSVRSRQAA